MTAPHETDRFRNACEYTVTITFVVAGGARPQTAWRRAELAAERIVSAASRLADIVDVVARAGHSSSGETITTHGVAFAAANTGDPNAGGHLGRYLDPEHERALASLAAANVATEALHQADRERRRAVGCENAWRFSWTDALSCECAYCRPDEHLAGARPRGPAPSIWPLRCPCGATSAIGRCPRHRDLPLVLLDGDPATLVLLAEHQPVDRRDLRTQEPDRDHRRDQGLEGRSR